MHVLARQARAAGLPSGPFIVRERHQPLQKYTANMADSAVDVDFCTLGMFIIGKRQRTLHIQ
jgi:hypothetical protein